MKINPKYDLTGIDFDDLNTPSPTPSAQAGEGYFKPDKFLSNSKVKELAHMVDKGTPPESHYNQFRYGTLLDVYMTDFERFNETLFRSKKGNLVIKDEFGEVAHFSLKELEMIIKNKTAVFEKFPALQDAETQKVIRNEAFTIKSKTFDLTVRAKIKCDFYFTPEQARHLVGKVRKPVIVDLKSTSAPTYKDFMTNFWNYEYHRQAAFYTDVAQACSFWIVAVNRASDVFAFRVTPQMIQAGRLNYTNAITKAFRAGLLEKYIAK